MSDLKTRLRSSAASVKDGKDAADCIEALEAELGKLQEAYNTMMNSNLIEALEAESDEFERTVMRLELAEERVKELEAALRTAQDSLEWHSDEKSRAAHAEIEKVLK